MSQIVSVGTSNDDDLLAPYGLTEAQIAMAALDGITYAHDKAGGNRARFVAELVGEFELALYEAMGIEPPED
jgi:hypothetical protein